MIRTGTLSRLLGYTQGLVLDLAARSVGRSGYGDRTALIPTTGAGNIGDQALFNAFVGNLDGPVEAVVTSADAFRCPERYADRVTFLELPAIEAGSVLAHVKDLVRIGRLIGRSRALAVIGADIMDGGYSAPMASVRWASATTAARRGLPTLVSSMSWNGRPAPGIEHLARRATNAGAVIGARDPESARRLRAAGVEHVLLTSDVVFELTEAQEPEPSTRGRFEQWRQDDRPLIVLNVSGLIGASGNRAEEYRAIAAHCGDLGAQILLMPHVSRSKNDDVVAQDTALPAAEWPEAFRIDALLQPDQVSWFATRATAVVSGRMHLSILALNQGVPAIVLSTQGKVAGLMESFGCPDRCIEPAAGLADQVIVQLDAVLADVPAARADLAAHLPAVRERSALGFSELTRPRRDARAAAVSA